MARNAAWLRHVVVVAAFTPLTLLAAACSDPLNSSKEAAAARSHLASLLDVMEANSINRLQINWPDFRTAVLAEAPDPRNIRDTFDAIHVALGLLGDNHSSYTSPPSYGATIRNSRISCTADLPATLDVPNDIGYVRVNGFSGSTSAGNTHATNVQLTIANEDQSAPIAWIVDLRGNSGDNMWPTITGLGPILGEGTLGYFIHPDGVEAKWEYRHGVAILNGLTSQAVASPYTLKKQNPYVAVLMDGRVSSAGEAVAVAFKGRPNTRFFGTPTCGLSTANAPFAVDDATLNLTVSTFADRNKVVYGDTIPPDVITNQGELLERAVDWLRGTQVGSERSPGMRHK